MVYRKFRVYIGFRLHVTVIVIISSFFTPK